MQAIVTDVRDVCQSVSLSVTWLNSASFGLFGSAFAKLLWPIDLHIMAYILLTDNVM